MLPSWRPAAGDAAVITGSTVLYDIRPSTQAFDPGTEPWKTSNNYTFSTITGYCGGAWIDELRMYVSHGGGHASYCVPAFYRWAAETLDWAWLQDPLPTDGMSAAISAGGIGGDVTTARSTAATAYGDKFDADEWHYLGSGSWPTGFGQPGVIQPEAAHSYFGNVWVPGSSWGNANGAVLKLYPGSGRAPDCLVPTRHYFDLDTNEWGLTANFRSNPSAAAGGSIYFGGSIDRVFSCTNTSGGAYRSQLDMLTPSTKTWSTVSTSNEIILWVYSGGFIAHLDSTLLIWCPPATSQSAAAQTSTGATQHQFWAVDAAALKAGSSPSWAQLTISNPGGTWPLKTPSGYTSCGSVRWTYCPENGKCYAINGNHNSTSLWELAPPSGATDRASYLAGTWTVTEHTLATGIPCGSTGSATGGTNEPYDRLVWSTRDRCLLWFDFWYQNRPVAITPPGM